MLTLYKNIHELRVKNKMTQQELADRLGYDRSMIAKIEAGKVDLAHSKILEIAKLFGVDAGDLMGDDGTADSLPNEATYDSQTKEFADYFQNISEEDRPTVLRLLQNLQPRP